MAAKKPPVIVWLRNDLRLEDNPALHAAETAAESTGRQTLLVYIHDPAGHGPAGQDSAGQDSEGQDSKIQDRIRNTAQCWAPGGASNWWLHHSLIAFNKSLKTIDNRLRVFSGNAKQVLQTIVDETSADTLFWNRCYEPDSIARDSDIKKFFIERHLNVTSYPGNYCHEPWQIRREGKHPYRVFSAYWRASLKQDSLPVSKTIQKLPTTRAALKGEVKIKSLDLLPTQNWDSQFVDYWKPGEATAQLLVDELLSNKIDEYDSSRDIPAIEGTSRLSPHLAFGEISPRQINAAIGSRLQQGTLLASDDTECFLREIGWREFANHLLYHFPATTSQPLDSRFANFPWLKIEPANLHRWQQGNTGIPLVDAGMRQLWQTGWMHNRVRMVVGSLLIKNLGYHWLEGARWFWDTLVDADLASNTMGWQWVAGSGADAAPYFRVFNPVRQGERFDPEGIYVKRWVPELQSLPRKYIHAPWTAPADVLSNANIELGNHYPVPIVDLASSRKEALSRFDKIKQAHAT